MFKVTRHFGVVVETEKPKESSERFFFSRNSSFLVKSRQFFIDLVDLVVPVLNSGNLLYFAPNYGPLYEKKECN